MAQRKHGRMQTVAVVLDRDQVADLKALRDRRSTRHAAVSFSAVVREVIDAGMGALRLAPDTTIAGTLADAEREVA